MPQRVHGVQEIIICYIKIKITCTRTNCPPVLDQMFVLGDYFEYKSLILKFELHSNEGINVPRRVHYVQVSSSAVQKLQALGPCQSLDYISQL